MFYFDETQKKERHTSTVWFSDETGGCIINIYMNLLQNKD